MGVVAVSLRRDFLDAPHWRRLAQARGLRLPAWTLPVTPHHMRRWLRRLGIPTPVYLRAAGERTLSDFSRRNPDWPLAAWVGEQLEELQ